MVTRAVNKRTRKEERIRDTEPCQLHECSWCGADMWPVFGSIMDPHYRLAAGQRHTHPICMQLDRSSIAYQINRIDRDEFFGRLFRPQKPVKTPPPPGGPDGPTEGEENPPEDELGNPGQGEDEPIIEPPKEQDPPPAVEPPEPKILACNTLAQAYRAGLADFPPTMRVGSGILADIFLLKKHFWRYLDTEVGSLGERVIELFPLTPYFHHNAILFSGTWHKKIADGKWKRKKMLFLLKLPDWESFNSVCKKLFENSRAESGKTTRIRKCNSVLVAGEWELLSPTKYRKYGIRVDDDCLGVQVAEYRSSRQLYPIPESKKHK